jgi:hypothetical protein
MSKSDNLEFMLKLYNSISVNTNLKLTINDIEYVKSELEKLPMSDKSQNNVLSLTKTLSTKLLKHRELSKSDILKSFNNLNDNLSTTSKNVDIHEFTKAQIFDDEFKNSAMYQQILTAEKYANEPFFMDNTMTGNPNKIFLTNPTFIEPTDEISTTNVTFNTDAIIQPSLQSKTPHSLDEPRDIVIGKLFDIDAVRDFQLALNPEIKYKNRFFVLDSTNYDSYDIQGRITWQLVPSRNLQTGVCNITKPMKNIVGMKLHQFKTTFTSTFLRRWTLYIEQLSAQSMVGPNGKKFHFLFTVKVGSNTALVHNFNQGYYWFNTPITQLTAITLTLGDPYNVIPINISANVLVGIEFIYIDDVLTSL